MSLKHLVLGLSVLLGGGAAAQSYQASAAPAAYPALTNPTPIVLSGSTPADNGRAVVPLGFTFPYFAKSYTQITVTANGMAFFESTTCTTCDYPGNTPLPSGNLPNGVIAPLWDDLKGGNSFSRLQWQPLSGPEGAGIALEWAEWNNWWSNSTYSLTFQARLWESGVVEFFYGPLTGTGSVLSAGAGIEDPTGTQGVAALACTNLQYGYCTFGDFTANHSVTFGPPVLPDLLVSRLTVGQVVLAGADLEITTSLAIRNWGQSAASGFGYRLYLSANTTFEPALDTPLNPAGQGPHSVSAKGFLNHPAVSTVPRPATGSYYVIAVLDDGSVVSESDEQNNIGSTATPLISGIDLVAQSLSGPVSGGPGETVTNHLVFTNQGIDSAGAVGFQIWLSADNLLDANDRLLHGGSVTVAGGQTISQDVSYPLPANIPSGDFWFVLQLDQGPAVGAVAEVSESNNVKFSSEKFTSYQADLAAGPVEVLAPAYFGENLALEATVSNLGGAAATGFSAVFYLSDNATLNGMSDPEMGALTGLSLAPGASMKVSLTRPVPAKAMTGADLPPGDYYFFLSVVGGGGQVEVSSANNVNKSAPRPVRLPAPDLVATALVGAPRAGVGEPMQVTRTLRNVGNRAAPPARYRYVLSANPIVTEQDLLLPIETASGTVNERTVTLAIGAEDSRTETVRIPLGVAPATYYLGVLVNPPGPGQVTEISVGNNGLATQLLEVVPQALRLLNPALPDAIVGLGYRFELAAGGGAVNPGFAIKGGAGELPPGISMSSGGVFTGTATDPGVHSFTVVLSEGKASAETRLVLRVLPFTGELCITTAALAPIGSGAAYQFVLSAAGGSGPYRWELGSGELPSGVGLNAEGILSGLPTDPVGTVARFTARVRDGAGGTAAREYLLSVLEAGAITISAAAVVPAVVDEDFVVDLVARNVSGAPLARPIRWSLVSGVLPPGLFLEPGDEVMLLRGRPTAPGNFPLGLAVHDGWGRADTADFVLVVNAQAIRVRSDLPAQLVRGQEVSAAFQVAASAEAAFALRGGILPPGLVLLGDGSLRGTVANEAPLGAYDFAIGATTSAGGRGLAPFRVEVTDAAGAPGPSCGCSHPVGLLGPGGLVLWVLAVRSRRRRGPLPRRGA